MTPINDPRFALVAVRKHRALVAVVALVTLAAVVVGTLMTTPIYEANAVVMVQLGREYNRQLNVGGQPTVLNRDPQAALNTELQILLSRDLTVAVVERLGAETLYPSLAAASGSDEEKRIAAVESLSEAFIARLLPESSVIQISLRHEKPAIAERALTTLYEEFREKHFATFSDPQMLTFLDERVAEYRDRLEASEEQLQQFLQANEPLNLEVDTGEGRSSERSRLEAELNQNESRIAGLRHQLEFLSEERTRAPNKSESDAIAQQSEMIRNARLKLLDLQVEEERLLGTYSQISRPVTAIREQIQIVQDFLTKQETAVGSGRLIETIAAEETRLNAELQFELARGWEMKQQLAALDLKMTKLPERTRRYRELARARDLNERYLNSYLAEQEQARLAADLDREKIASISLIQQVRVGVDPVTPNKKLNVGFGGVLALILGFGAALGAERFRGRRGAEPETLDESDLVPDEVAERGMRESSGGGSRFTARFEGPPPQGPHTL